MAKTVKAAPAKKTDSVVQKEPKKGVVKPDTTVADAPSWQTIHVFGHGFAQILGKGTNGAVQNDKLKALEPLLEHLATQQQKGTKVSLAEAHAINIFNNSFIDFIPRPGKNISQRFAWADVNTKLADKLAKELIAKIPDPALQEKPVNTGNSLRSTGNIGHAPASATSGKQIVSKSKKNTSPKK